MSGVFAKELRHNFRTLTGYVFIAIYLALGGVVFWTVNLLSQSGDIRATFSSMTTILVFLIPILTMGLFADEQRQKTDELLFTSPVTLTDVVLGKFGAAFVVFLIPLLLTMAQPLILARLGGSQPLAALVGCLGFALMGGCLISIGLFLSLMTDSAFVAAVFTYALFALTLFAQGAASWFSGAFWQKLLWLVAIPSHYESFNYGVVRLSDTLYFLSTTALFLYLSVAVLERRRLK